MQKMSKILLLLILSFSLLSMAACGKVSRTVPVEGSGYPHSYPRH